MGLVARFVDQVSTEWSIRAIWLDAVVPDPGSAAGPMAGPAPGGSIGVVVVPVPMIGVTGVGEAPVDRRSGEAVGAGEDDRGGRDEPDQPGSVDRAGGGSGHVVASL